MFGELTNFTEMKILKSRESLKQYFQHSCIRGSKQKLSFHSATPDDSLQVGEVGQAQVREMVEKCCLFGSREKVLDKGWAPLGHSHW